MINKELSELLDAISREKGTPMSPFEELLILGYYPEARKRIMNSEVDEEEDFDDFIQEDEEYSEAEEEYEFDEDEDYYALLQLTLCRNNDRKKYFA